MSGRQEGSSNNFKFPWELQVLSLAREIAGVQLLLGSSFELLLPRPTLKEPSPFPRYTPTAHDGSMDSLRSVILALASYSLKKLRTVEFIMFGGNEIKPSSLRDSIDGSKRGEASMGVADWPLSCLAQCQDKFVKFKSRKEIRLKIVSLFQTNLHLHKKLLVAKVRNRQSPNPTPNKNHRQTNRQTRLPTIRPNRRRNKDRRRIRVVCEICS